MSLNFSTANCTKVLEFTHPNRFPANANIPFLIIVAIFTVVVLATLCFQTFILSQKGSLNPNFHLVFIVSNSIALADSILVLLFLVYHIHGLANERNPAYHGIPWLLCVSGRNLRFFLRSIDFWLVFCGGLERFVQALRRKFTDPPHITIGGVAMVLVALACSTLMVLPATVLGWDMDKPNCYCLPEMDSELGISLYRLIVVVLQSFSTMILYFVSFRISSAVAKDFHLDTCRHSLQERFAVSANLKLGRTLIAIGAVHMIGDISFSLIKMGIQLMIGSSEEVMVFVKTLLYLSSLLQSFTQVVIQNTLHDTLKRRVVRALGLDRGRVAPKKDYAVEEEIEMDPVVPPKPEPLPKPTHVMSRPSPLVPVDSVEAYGITSKIWADYVERVAKK